MTYPPEQLTPYGWWWSGKFWYCKLHPKVLSGCGPTKPQAAHDAMKELRKHQKRGIAAMGAK